MVKIFIDKEFIGAVIGPQGKIIQEIQRETGTTINLEEVGNFGEVSIFSPPRKVSTRPLTGSRASSLCLKSAPCTKPRSNPSCHMALS